MKKLHKYIIAPTILPASVVIGYSNSVETYPGRSHSNSEKSSTHTDSLLDTINTASATVNDDEGNITDLTFNLRQNGTIVQTLVYTNVAPGAPPGNKLTVADVCAAYDRRYRNIGWCGVLVL